MTPGARAAMLAATRGAAAAFLEDAAHIRTVLGRCDILRPDVRQISNILRRLLIDSGGDLQKIAAPRVGRLEVLAPDNDYYYTVDRRAPLIEFVSGGYPLFGLRFRALTHPQNGIDPERPSDEVVALRLDGFLSQRVIARHGHWINRRNVIKYVANVASGVHSAAPQGKDETILHDLQNEVHFEWVGDACKITIKPLRFEFKRRWLDYNPKAIDKVYEEVLSAAHYLIGSPSVMALEKTVALELGIEPGIGLDAANMA